MPVKSSYHRLGVVGGVASLLALGGSTSLVLAILFVAGYRLHDDAGSFVLVCVPFLGLAHEGLRTTVRVTDAKVAWRRYGVFGPVRSLSRDSIRDVEFCLSEGSRDPMLRVTTSDGVIILGPWDGGFRQALESRCRRLIAELQVKRRRDPS